MSDVERFSQMSGAMVQGSDTFTGKPSGDWVRASDYDALGEYARLLAELLGRFYEFQFNSVGCCEWCDGTDWEHARDCVYPEVKAALAKNPSTDGTGSRQGTDSSGGKPPYPAASGATLSDSSGAPEPSTFVVRHYVSDKYPTIKGPRMEFQVFGTRDDADDVAECLTDLLRPAVFSAPDNGPVLGPNDPLPCVVKCLADEGDGGIAFGKGVKLSALLDYLARRVTYNNLPPSRAWRCDDCGAQELNAALEPFLCPHCHGVNVRKPTLAEVVGAEYVTDSRSEEAK